jgi:O-antigen/teichoic acid export membrane protein
MSLVIRDVVAVVAPPTYAPAAALVPLILAAYVWNGIGTYFELGLKLVNKTPLLGAIFAGTCLVCLGLYGLLIPRYGMFGAVAATFLAFVAKAIWVYRESQRVFPVRYEFGRLAKAALLALGFWVARALLPPLPHLVSFLVGLVLFAAYLATLWLSGWMGPKEKDALTAWLRRGPARLRPAEAAEGK